MIRVRAPRIDATARCLLALFVVLSIGSGCDWRGRPTPEDRPVPATAVVNFAELYRVNCAGCHGLTGSHGPAPPLNDQLFLEIVPADVLEDVIRSGRAGTPMPAFGAGQGGTLTDEQVRALADGLKSHWFEGNKSETTKPPTYLAVNEVTAPGENQPPGAKLFAVACAGCHGQDGHGGSAGALNDAAFLTLISDQALRRLVITGRPDLGMPTFAEDEGRGPDFKPLNSQQVSALVALLADWRVTASSQSRRGTLVGEASHGAKQ